MLELKKIQQVVMAEILPRAGLEPSSVDALKSAKTVDVALQNLMASGAMVDAIKLMAHALPKRESVWWACTCCRAYGVELLGDDLAAVKAAEKWVYEQTDANARAAYEFGERLGFKTPAGWAAVSAMWSSGSLAPPGQAIVPPPPYLTGVAVAGAVMLAAVMEPVTEMETRHSRFLQYAMEIAAGGDARRADGSPR